MTRQQWQEANRKQWAVEVSYSQFDTDLVFDSDIDMDTDQAMFLTGLSYSPIDRLTVRLALGAIQGGEMEGDAGEFDVTAGVVGSASVLWRFVDPKGWKPFVLGSLSLAASKMGTRDKMFPRKEAPMWATDARIGVQTGWVVWKRWFPYLGVRLFGGPVFWEVEGEEVSGSDKYHFQLAVGSSVALGKGYSVFADWSFLGEQAVSAGVAYAF